MAKRDTLYRQFGPILLEALVEQLLKEINELRTKLALPPRTMADFLSTVHHFAPELPPYDWMQEQTDFPP